MNEHILCIDIGTTSLKAGIVDPTGKLTAYTKIELTGGDFAANEWLTAFESAKKRLSLSYDAICVSGNGPTIASESGRTILWNDGKCEQLKKIQGQTFPQTKSLFLPQIAAFKYFFNEEYNNSKWIFSGPEFLIWKLTGNAKTVLPESRFQAAYWNEENASAFSIDADKLPPFTAPGTLAGYDANNIPVFYGAPDFVVALIGTNTLKSGTVCDRAGSSEGLNLCVSNPVFDSMIRTLPSVIPGLWNLSVLIPESGSLFSSYKKEYENSTGRKIDYEELTRASMEDKNSQGWYILNSILTNFNHGIQYLKKIARENNLSFPQRLSITGGQAKNSQWLMLKAQKSQTTLIIQNCADAELIGDAILANVGLGNYASISEAADKMVYSSTCVEYSKPLPSKPAIYNLEKGRSIKAIIFDIDSTLYTSAEYAFEQVDAQIRFWAKKQGISESQARMKISEYRRKWSAENGGKKISLGNTFINFGVSIEDSIKMRQDLLEPANFLQKDEKMILTIRELAKFFRLICVTNNPVLPARKTLQAIGIDQLIPEIIGLDTCHKSKPAKEPFMKALEILGVSASQTVSVGDRYDMDIRLPLEMGMSGILVNGVEDVYTLPELLKPFSTGANFNSEQINNM